MDGIDIAGLLSAGYADPSAAFVARPQMMNVNFAGAIPAGLLADYNAVTAPGNAQVSGLLSQQGIPFDLQGYLPFAALNGVPQIFGQDDYATMVAPQMEMPFYANMPLTLSGF